MNLGELALNNPQFKSLGKEFMTFVSSLQGEMISRGLEAVVVLYANQLVDKYGVRDQCYVRSDYAPMSLKVHFVHKTSPHMLTIEMNCVASSPTSLINQQTRIES